MPHKHDGYLPLAEAAHRLGISHASAAKRIERGTLPAIKRGGRWYIHVDNLDTERDDTATTPDDKPDADTGTKPDATTTDLDTTARLVEALTAQVTDLQRRLDRQDVHIQMLIGKLPNPDAALPVIEEGSFRHDAADEPSDRPRREGTPETGQESMIASWWRRLIGRG